MVVNKFVFVHVPKTAGGSFSNMLHGAYSSIIRDLPSCSKCENYDVIYGQFTYYKYLYLNRPQITFVRDPVEMTISGFYFLKHGIKNIRHYAEAYANCLCYYIGSPHYFDFIGIQEQFDSSVERFEAWAGVKLSKVPRRNVTEKGVVTTEDREYIRRLNKRDYELYNTIVGTTTTEEEKKLLGIKL